MRLGERIKRYEACTRQMATPRVPLIVRVDGRAFHTFTKGMERPFDKKLMSAMVEAAKDVARDMQGFKAAYVQSDGATFLMTDYDSIEAQGWFGGNLQKIVSISAAMMSVGLIKHLGTTKQPVFDSRAFCVPVDDVVNTFLWRAKDWERNSLQMYCRSFFTHKELIRKKKADMHNMLHDIGRNWATDLLPQQRNGTFIIKQGRDLVERFDIEPNHMTIKSAIGKLIIPGRGVLENEK